MAGDWQGIERKVVEEVEIESEPGNMVDPPTEAPVSSIGSTLPGGNTGFTYSYKLVE